MSDPVHRFELRVPDDVVDANRHVNNVAYVQWMQDAATRHSDAVEIYYISPINGQEALGMTAEAPGALPPVYR